MSLSLCSLFRTPLSFLSVVSSELNAFFLLDRFVTSATDRVCFLVGPVSHIGRQSSTLVVSLGHLQPFVSPFIPSVLLHHGSNRYLSLPVECSFLRAYQSHFGWFVFISYVHLLISHFINISSSSFYLKSGPLITIH